MKKKNKEVTYIAKDRLHDEHLFFLNLKDRFSYYKSSTKRHLDYQEQVRENLQYAFPKARTISKPFSTLLALYHTTGLEQMISGKNIVSILHPLPFIGTYHTHDFIEILYVARGSFAQYILGEKHVFHEGELVITDCNCEHADYLTATDGEVAFLSINPDFLEQALGSYAGNDEMNRFLFHALGKQKKEQSFLHFAPYRHSEQIERIMESLVQEDHEEAAGYLDIIRAQLVRLFYILCNFYVAKLHGMDADSREKMLLYEVERYIRLHAADITTEKLEQGFHYHRNYYNLLIKKYRGVTLKEYIQNLRIRKAMQLLKETDLSIKEVASQSGYENTSFFYQLFEKKVKLSPFTYREESRR